MSDESDSWLQSIGVDPGYFLCDVGAGPPPPRDDPLVGQNKPVDTDDKFFTLDGIWDFFGKKFGITGASGDVPNAKGDPARVNSDQPPTKSGPTKRITNDGPLPGPEPAPTAPSGQDIPPPPPPPPPLRTWGTDPPQPGDPNFIGPPPPPPPPQAEGPFAPKVPQPTPLNPPPPNPLHLDPPDATPPGSDPPAPPASDPFQFGPPPPGSPGVGNF
jgi:hypothetical protein